MDEFYVGDILNNAIKFLPNEFINLLNEFKKSCIE